MRMQTWDFGHLVLDSNGRERTRVPQLPMPSRPSPLRLPRSVQHVSEIVSQTRRLLIPSSPLSRLCLSSQRFLTTSCGSTENSTSRQATFKSPIQGAFPEGTLPAATTCTSHLHFTSTPPHSHTSNIRLAVTLCVCVCVCVCVSV